MKTIFRSMLRSLWSLFSCLACGARPWGEGKLKDKELSLGFRHRVAKLLANSEDLTMLSTWEMEQEGSGA